MEKKQFIQSTINVLCGGTPCQTFSVAGLGGSLSDERGRLTFEFCRIAHIKKPRWILWENVVGVLGKKDNPFGCFLAGLSGASSPILPFSKNGKWSKSGIVPPSKKDGYGLVWRVLDAKYFGVPQQRRRVFVVGYIGDWRPAAKVLLESQSLRGNSEEALPQKGEKESFGINGLPTIVGTITKGYGKSSMGAPEVDANLYINTGSGLRRLTPIEVERCFGFPDNYTSVEYNKKIVSDGPRLSALGNSWVIPCVRWIGERISIVDFLHKNVTPGINGKD